VFASSKHKGGCDFKTSSSVRSDFFEGFDESCLSFKGSVVLCQYSHPIFLDFASFVCLFEFWKESEWIQVLGDGF